MAIVANDNFKDLYDRIVRITGKSNQGRQIVQMIQDVTLEEHMARRYFKDRVTSFWSAKDIEGGCDEPDPCCFSNPVTTIGVLCKLSFELPVNALRGFTNVHIETEHTSDDFTENDLTKTAIEYSKADVNTMQGVVAYYAQSVIKIKSGSPIEGVTLTYFNVPDVSAEGYDSWIGNAGSLYQNVIVNEVAARILNSIGAHNANDLFRIATRARKHLRIDAKHEIIHY